MTGIFEILLKYVRELEIDNVRVECSSYPEDRAILMRLSTMLNGEEFSVRFLINESDIGRGKMAGLMLKMIINTMLTCLVHKCGKDDE